MSDYNAPEFGLGNGRCAFEWQGTPSTFASPKAIVAARHAAAIAAANSKIDAIVQLHGLSRASDESIRKFKAAKAASAFNVQIASRDSSDRTNSIRGRL